MKTPAKRPVEKEVFKNFVSWFEIPATNFERAVNFYESIYQIKLDTHQTESFEMAYFPAEGGVGGAIICGEGSSPSDTGSLIYLNGGQNLQTLLDRIPKAGGRVLLEKQLISEEAGCFALFIDSEGNKLALHSKS
ncbi:MAG: VOC family protein [Vicingaceae bacterium]